MQRVSGDLDCQGAIFIFKDDTTSQSAWLAAQQVSATHGGIRTELHDSSQMLLQGLRNWNNAVDPTNAYLCIYSHGIVNGSGIAAGNPNNPQSVGWTDIAAALPRGVEVLWLAGCRTDAAMRHWRPLCNPVRGLLLATSVSRYWGELLSVFQAEISIAKIVCYNKMPAKIRNVGGVLGCYTHYYRPTPQGFERAFVWEQRLQNLLNLCCVKRLWERVRGTIE